LQETLWEELSMSFKIKLFSATQNNIGNLENEVNSWMSQNSDYNIKDIKVTYSDHNILMTIIYESQGKAMQSAQTMEMKPSQSFQETLSTYTVRQDPPPPRPKSQDSSPQNIAAAIDALNPGSVKPGKLIQNNYSKYNKSNQKISEDQAFDWD
jgi:hypothetical protein